MSRYARRLCAKAAVTHFPSLPRPAADDQEQTPEHPGGGAPYPVDGECYTQCDCGVTNPCGEYIFNHSGGVVEGRSFRDWFIYEYMITPETLNHTDPATGLPAPIGLGWLDDSMTMNGPTEEDSNYIADTGASTQDMADQVAAYQESMQALIRAVIPLGGFYWQLMDGGGAQLNKGINVTVNGTVCRNYLRSACVASPSAWNRFQMFVIPSARGGCARVRCARIRCARVSCAALASAAPH